MSDDVMGMWKNALLKRRPVFASPEEFAEACFDYFQWASSSKIEDTRASHYKGEVFHLVDEKHRAFSWRALRLFLGVSSATLSFYKQKEEFKDVVEAVDDIIFTQKFEGAAAGTLNASVIQRDLGLADKQVVEGGDRPVGYSITGSMDIKMAMETYEATLNPDK